ncbi:hypothetical protein QA802_07650 [Streptomyces sp. B21-105]|uniref:hypothetical protein n=1 Tax=Streptomyces sp. B21-105 TaxID=3039417 RepID=UPI002FEE9147
MTAVHAAPAALASMLLALGVGMTMIGRSWPHRAKHRGPRAPRQVEEYVPAAALIPAFAGTDWPTPAFAHCIQCRTTVPVVVHTGAHRCTHGHVTTHTTTGSTL